MREYKNYTVHAAAEIDLNISTDKPENIRELVEKNLHDSAGINAKIADIRITESVLPEQFKQTLYTAFTGGKG